MNLPIMLKFALASCTYGYRDPISTTMLEFILEVANKSHIFCDAHPNGVPKLICKLVERREYKTLSIFLEKIQYCQEVKNEIKEMLKLLSHDEEELRDSPFFDLIIADKAHVFNLLKS
jgi:hypothetical protein